MFCLSSEKGYKYYLLVWIIKERESVCVWCVGVGEQQVPHSHQQETNYKYWLLNEKYTILNYFYC